MNSKKFTHAFTLIEIMVVISVISILLAFAIPQMLRSRMNANELAAISALRTISNACQCYYNGVIPHGYPPDAAAGGVGLLELASPNSIPAYINTTLASATDEDHTKQGYYFQYTRINEERFTIIAWPKYFGRTGARNFFVNELGTLTYTGENGTAPTENDLPVE